MNVLKYFLLASMLVFGGCADDGDPGPQGEKGDKGDTGEEGPQGTTGTANVMYSEWMDFDWNVYDDPAFKQMAIDEPEITEDFLEDGGVILLYLKASSSAGIISTTQLPYTSGNDYLYGITAIIPDPLPPLELERGIVLNLVSLDGSTPVSDFQDVPDAVNYDLRYVLIPGGVSINATSSGRATLNKYDYDRAKQMFNIPD